MTSSLESMLAELSRDWQITLTNGPDSGGWFLQLSSRAKVFSYRGTLANVVSRAWAGERGDSSPITMTPCDECGTMTPKGATNWHQCAACINAHVRG